MTSPLRLRRLGIVLLCGLAVAGAGGWYWFRPERAFIDVHAAEPAPAFVSQVAVGGFVPGAHEGAGRAAILRLEGGRHVLRLSSFRTLNGPDVRVYLLGARDVNDRETLRAAGYVDLGPLKANVGDQNYELPADVDPGRYPAVSVWCRRFGVNFTAAALAPSDASARD